MDVANENSKSFNGQKLPDTYPISRDAEESDRLDHQHLLLVSTLGYYIHPHVVRHALGNEVECYMAVQAAVERGEGADSLTFLLQDLLKRNIAINTPGNVPQIQKDTIRIADIATGTGVWLFGLKRQLSQLPTTTKVELHGFDISDAQFPSKRQQNHPETTDITFHVQNAKLPFPEAFHGKFDIVNIRYITMAMENAEDWAAVTRNVLALLKPGGALQWTEPNVSPEVRWSRSSISSMMSQDPADADEDDLDVGVSFMNKHFRIWVQTFSERLNNGQNTLPQTYRDLGLVHIIDDIVHSDRVPSLRYKTSINFIEGWMNVTRTLAQSGKSYMSEEELTHVFEKMKKYASLGTYNHHDIHTLVGYKPK